MSDEQIHEVGGFKYTTNKAGNRVGFSDAEREAKRGLSTLWHSLARMSRLAAEPHEGYDLDWEQIEWMIGKVEDLLRVWRTAIDEHGGRRRKEERIEALRAIAGRTPAEAEVYRAKAAELEATL